MPDLECRYREYFDYTVEPKFNNEQTALEDCTMDPKCSRVIKLCHQFDTWQKCMETPLVEQREHRDRLCPPNVQAPDSFLYKKGQLQFGLELGNNKIVYLYRNGLLYSHLFICN